MMDYARVHQDISRGVAGKTLPGLAARELAGIADGRDELLAVRHPLGFACFPLLREGDAGICVHVWAAETAAPAPFSVHSHSWDLLSYILYGTVRNQLVAVLDQPADPTHQVFEIRSRPGYDEVRATPRLVGWAPAGAQTVRAGSAYSISAGQFHALDIPLDYHAATVVLGQTRPDVADLSLGEIGAPDRRVHREQYSPGQTARLAGLAVRGIAETLASTPARH